MSEKRKRITFRDVLEEPLRKVQRGTTLMRTLENPLMVVSSEDDSAREMNEEVPLLFPVISFSQPSPVFSHSSEEISFDSSTASHAMCSREEKVHSDEVPYTSPEVLPAPCLEEDNARRGGDMCDLGSSISLLGDSRDEDSILELASSSSAFAVTHTETPDMQHQQGHDSYGVFRRLDFDSCTPDDVQVVHPISFGCDSPVLPPEDCLLCRGKEINLKLPLLAVEGGSVHIACALFAPEVFYDSRSDTLENVRSALIRSSKILCAQCGEYGASIGCVSEACPRSFHLPCALVLNGSFSIHDFSFLCPLHGLST